MDRKKQNTTAIVIGVLLSFCIGGCLGYQAGDKTTTMVKVDTVFVKYNIKEIIPSKPINVYIPIIKKIYSMDTIRQRNDYIDQQIIIRDTIDSTGIIFRELAFDGTATKPIVNKLKIKEARFISLYCGMQMQTHVLTPVDVGPSIGFIIKGNKQLQYSYGISSGNHMIGISAKIW